MAKKNKENIQYWLDSGIDIQNRQIMLDTDIESETIGKIIRSIYSMMILDKNLPIDIIINSYGGDIYSSLAVYDILRMASNNGIKIRTTAFTAMSGGLIIYLAGDERNCLVNSTLMAHSVSAGVEGKIEDMVTDLKETKRLQEIMVSILASRTKKSKRFWKKEIKHKDRFYDIKMAKKLGIING